MVEKNLSASWMPGDAQFVKWALDEAVWWRCPEIIAPLRRIAKELGVSHWRSFLYGAAVRRPCPEWVAIEPQVLLE